jgi:diguanylate cyclase (GGDEF)-like protein
VKNLFEALGALATAERRAPIDTVLVRAEVAAAAGGRGAEALRRIDPAVRVALILDSDRGESAAGADRFDLVLRLPADAAALHELIDGQTLTDAAARSAPSVMEPLASSVPVPAPAPLPEPVPPAPTVAAPIPAAPAPAAPAQDERLGDVDLVEHMLQASREGGAPLAPLALRLIRQQTRWSDLRLVAPEDLASLEPGLAATEVRRGQRLLGWLASCAAGSAELAPWAEWLACWLDLESRWRESLEMAYHDDLTGAWNRRYYDAFLAEGIPAARARRCQVTVMVFDIDNFKQFNDQFGHEAGDEVLVETVRLLQSVIRRSDRVCRIGGDEFAVIFADLDGPRERGSRHPTEPEQIAARFQGQVSGMKFPKLGAEAPGPLTISAGLATFPWDGDTAEELLRQADRRALQSKRAGKNAITLGPVGPR